MRHIVKWLFILVVLAAILLVVYTYVGPYFGADFSPPRSEIRQPVTLDAQ